MSIPGPNVLLVGDSGTGKTYSLRTLIPAGVTPCIVFTEPGMEVLGDIPCPSLHWHYIPPARQNWKTFLETQTQINTMPIEAIAKLPDMQKQQYRQFLTMLTMFSDFVCDRCGAHLGDVTEWDTDMALVLDSLSGLNIIAMDHVVGGKPVKSIQNWGIAMDGIEKLLNKLTTDTRCTLVITAHLEREVDEITGATQTMASTLGRRLAPKIPRFFSDVIQTVREGEKFTWSTVSPGVVSKARNVPWAHSLPPDFGPLLEVWKSHGGIIVPTPAAHSAAATP